MASGKNVRRGKKADGKKVGGKKRQGSVRRSGGLSRLSGRARGLLSREVCGVALLAAGLFFAAAFASGRGAFLGDAGLAAVTRLLGVAGLALAPLAAVAGVLLLLRWLSARRALGAGLLLLAAAVSLAAGLPAGRRFDAELYTGAGGILGSVLYAGVEWAGGVVGVVVVLSVLYALGLYLLTGLTPGTVLSHVRNAIHKLRARPRPRSRVQSKQSLAQRKSEVKSPRGRGREERAATRRDRDEKAPSPPGSEGGTEGLEVVLPEPLAEAPGLERSPEPVSEGYAPPPMSLLEVGGGSRPGHDAEEVSRRLTEALADLGVQARVLRAVVGPRVTRYELRLGSGVKVGKVRNLQQDIAYALAATEVRILAPIPGKSAVGVEVPNTRPATVTLGDVFQEYPGANEWALPVGLGKDISGKAVFLDLAEMPHLLVAGTTGSGKSVMLNGLLTSLLLTTDPRQVKMVLVDPKRVELSQFGRIPHLITPVVTDVKKASNALSWAVAEMERRYEVLEGEGVRSLEGYNELAESQMPYVVVVIDELADLMMAAAAKVEDAVIRLAQKARAVGIHLVIATQRPSVDVITGMIKANVPSRIAFAVSSQVDSRVILDTQGAEALLGSGDMLYKPVSAPRPSRVQGAFITDGEVERIVSASSTGARASYVEEVTEHREGQQESEEPEDGLLPEAASFVVSTQQASVSAVQRRFRVGYSRAGRLIDALERKGVVGPYEGSKPRSVVASEVDLGAIFGGEEEEGEALPEG